MMHVTGLKTYYLNGFKAFGHIITSIVNFILLALVYFIGIAVVAIFSKLVGKRFIDTEKHDRPSHWKTYNLSTKPLKEYFRQF